MNKISLFFIFFSTITFANTSNKVSNPFIESIEIRSNSSQFNSEDVDAELRFNFNADKASIEVKNLYNSYLKYMSQLNAMTEELETSKTIISLNLSKTLFKELNLYLKKFKIINTRSVALKYKEKEIMEDINLIELDIQYWQRILDLKNIKNLDIEYTMPELNKIKDLNYKDSLSAKMLYIEKDIISYEQQTNSGVKFLSLTSDLDNQTGIKFGYAFRFGEGAKESFKKIKNLREINSSLKENRLKFIKLKHEFSKSILRYNNVEEQRRRASRRSQSLKDKNLILSEIYSLINLTLESYKYQIQMITLFNEFISFWGAEL